MNTITLASLNAAVVESQLIGAAQIQQMAETGRPCTESTYFMASLKVIEGMVTFLEAGDHSYEAWFAMFKRLNCESEMAQLDVCRPFVSVFNEAIKDPVLMREYFDKEVEPIFSNPDLLTYLRMSLQGCRLLIDNQMTVH
jgi:hypothetical protein